MFLGVPVITCLGPNDPGELARTCHDARTSTAFRWVGDVGLARSISGLVPTACDLAVYASQPGLPRSTQDSLPAVASFAGRDWLPAGLTTRFPFSFHAFLPPCPSFHVATTPAISALTTCFKARPKSSRHLIRGSDQRNGEPLHHPPPRCVRFSSERSVRHETAPPGCTRCAAG